MNEIVSPKPSHFLSAQSVFSPSETTHEAGLPGMCQPPISDTGKTLNKSS